MPTIAFVSPKGGCGKTTAALLLALGLADRGRRVALIDTDPNKPLLHWAALPGRPSKISVHAAPTLHDMADARREAAKHAPDWTIVDTEGSVRGGMVFAGVRLDLVITPLNPSALDAIEARRAAQLIDALRLRADQRMKHRALLTRVPSALRPASIGRVVEELRVANVELLPTALVDKEVFRTLFAVGGSLADLARSGAWGVSAAQTNVDAYVEAVLETTQSS
ncbi:division plane positioning ATPase MipZ [Phenylobacterium sp.]|uniref:nucleotide-binding protein n=1 Tax=Phenylobacterium sp. TaxID=1871053 RepID=UPI0037850D5C